MSAARTLIAPVVERARAEPERTALVFLGEDGSRARWSAAELDARSRDFARALGGLGIVAGDRVILVLRHSPELLAAFWGAMYIGAVPSIFPFLTEKLDPGLYATRVRLLVAHAQARAVVTFPEFAGRLGEVLAGLPCRVLAEDGTVREREPAEMHWADPSPDDVAFLQHSSGTTGLQKGVALSHRSVLSQVECYGRAIGLGPDDVVVSWLPLYHDMGLIAGFVMPIVAGVRLVLMSPFHWVRSPKILFQAIHEHRGTLCWLPNFAYNHCADTIRARDLQGLDLGCLRAVVNCSEPVRHGSHEVFLRKFSAHGLRPEALATCYAMAENTFAVTQSAIGAPPRVDWVSRRSLQEQGRAAPAKPGDAGAVPVVSCGTPIPGVRVAIAGGDGRWLPERQEGEIVLRGDSMLKEFDRRPDLTAQAIRDGWYSTGDRGYLADGHLYVTGRQKDLIIVGGKNLFPQDLEAIADGVPGLNAGRNVAFGLLDEALGTEAIVMVCELDAPVGTDEREAIAREVRRRVVQEADVTLKDVRVVEGRWVIKTSSGKLARADNRDKYLRETGKLQETTS